MEYLDGVSLDDYLGDQLRRRAVERELEIIGEALGRLRRVDPDTARSIPNLAETVGLRNVLIHGYATVIDERVFDTASADVPALLAALVALLDAGD